jgi:hypothetical protein
MLVYLLGTEVMTRLAGVLDELGIGLSNQLAAFSSGSFPDHLPRSNSYS